MFVRFDGNGRQQIVCLDHGLYADMRDEIRQQYCKFWVNLVLTDTEGLKEVCDEWGLGDAELFAQLTIMKPYSKEKAPHLKNTTRRDLLMNAKEMKARGYQRIINMLKDQEKIPEELVILGRHMNIVRANNAAMVRYRNLNTNSLLQAR